MSAGHEKTGYEKKDINLLKVSVVTTVTTLAILASLVFLDQYFILYTENLVYERKLAPESEQLRALQTSEAEVLNNYKVIDAEKNVYQIPINRAMALMVNESRSKALRTQRNVSKLRQKMRRFKQQQGKR